MAASSRIYRRLLCLLLTGMVAAFASAPTPTPLFENFEGGSAPDWTTRGGTWALAAGTYGNTAKDDATALHRSLWGTNYTLRASVRLDRDDAGSRAGLVYADADAQNFCRLLLSATGTVELSQTSRGTASVRQSGSYPGFGPNAWVEVEIVREGDATTVRINGARVFYRVSQPGLADGQIGLTTGAGPARFDNVSVTPTVVQAYAEDFGDGHARDWAAATGTWTVSDGAYGIAAAGAHDVTTYGGENWSSGYTYHLSLRSPATGPAPRMGAVYNYVDAKNYCEVVLSPAGTAEIRRTVDGASTTQATAAYSPAAANCWLDLAILRTGTATTVNVEGRRVFTDVPQADLGAGRIGLVASGGPVQFDDLVVMRGLDPYRRTFPKIGGVFIGGPRDFDQPALQDALARHDLAFVGLFAGFKRGGKEPAQLVREIKARNPNLVLGNYACVMETYDDAAASHEDLIAKLNGEKGPPGAASGKPNDWWLRNSEGEKVGEYPRTRMINGTYYTQPDAGGFRYPQWCAVRNQSALFFDSADIDFMMSDNCYAEPAMFYIKPTPPDWNRDGVNDKEGDPWARDFRLGMATFWMKFRQLNPTRFVFGNVGGQRHSNPLARPEYQDLLAGALDEGFMGKRYSEETWSGWDNAMDSYHDLVTNTAPPHLVMNATRSTPAGEASDEPLRARYAPGYGFMRCALASTLMDDGYFSCGGESYNIEKSYWFDEYDQRLGLPVDPPQRKPWRNGVYLRRFQNGAALVNPRTNAAQTVDLTGLGYTRFKGRQDPVTNNGAAVTTLTLAAGDGIILLRAP